MTTTIRAGHASLLPVDDWLAGLRDGESAEPGSPGTAEPADPGPGGPGYAVPASYGHDVPASPGRAEPPGHVLAVPAEPGYTVPASHGRAGPAAGGARPQAPAGPVTPSASAATAAPARTAAPAVPARPAARTTAAGPAGAAVRAVIGDQLRLPVMWCEMGSCRSRHADPAALGEADARARAIAAGWRIDAVGRLACPRCQQSDPGSWAAPPVAAPDPDMALASTAPMPAVPGDSTARGAALRLSRDLRRAGRGYSLAAGRSRNGTPITRPMRPGATTLTGRMVAHRAYLGGLPAGRQAGSAAADGALRSHAQERVRHRVRRAARPSPVPLCPQFVAHRRVETAVRHTGDSSWTSGMRTSALTRRTVLSAAGVPYVTNS